MEKKKAGQNPETPNPGTNNARTIMISALMMSHEIPRVTMLIGSVRIPIIGLMKILTSPSTTARTSAPISVTWTPGTRYAAIRIAIVRTSQ